MNGKFPVTLGALACLGLFACNELEKPSAVKDKEDPANTGRALVHLPRISKEFRPDSSRDTTGDFLLQLTVSGPGMAPMRDAVILRSTDTEPLELTGIPAGPTRIFSARLLWLDPMRGDSTITHEGADTVSIAAGAAAEVLLYLHRVAATGNARICVIVEGVTPDSACRKPIPPDTTVNPPKPDSLIGIYGCWKVGFHGMQGTMSLWNRQQTVNGQLVWADGTLDSVTGVFQYPYLKLFTMHGNRTSEFRGNVLAGVNHFEIKLMGTPMGVVEKMIGERGECRNVPPDSVGNGKDTVVTCWNVNQNLVNGIQGAGKLRLTRTPGSVSGGFEWNGYPMMPVTNGSAPVVPSPLYLFGIMPSKMADDGHGIDYAIHYKAKVSASGDSLEYGAVYRHAGSGDFTNADAFGSWGGHRTSCVDSVRFVHILKPDPIILFH